MFGFSWKLFWILSPPVFLDSVKLKFHQTPLIKILLYSAMEMAIFRLCRFWCIFIRRCVYFRFELIHICTGSFVVSRFFCERERERRNGGKDFWSQFRTFGLSKVFLSSEKKKHGEMLKQFCTFGFSSQGVCCHWQGEGRRLGFHRNFEEWMLQKEFKKRSVRLSLRARARRVFFFLSTRIFPPHSGFQYILVCKNNW